MIFFKNCIFFQKQSIIFFICFFIKLLNICLSALFNKYKYLNFYTIIIFCLNNIQINYYFIFMVFLIIFFKIKKTINFSVFFFFFIFCFFMFSTNNFFFNFKKIYYTLPNVNLINGVLLIHPVLNYIFIITALSLIHKTKLIYNFFINSIRLGFFLIFTYLSVFLGSYWAQQEINWGGWWNWDLVEVIPLLFLFLNLFNIHSKKLNLINLIHVHKIHCISYVFIFILVVRFDFFNSIHSFSSNLKVNKYYHLIFLSIFIIINYLNISSYVFKLYYNYKFFNKWNYILQFNNFTIYLVVCSLLFLFIFNNVNSYFNFFLKIIFLFVYLYLYFINIKSFKFNVFFFFFLNFYYLILRKFKNLSTTVIHFSISVFFFFSYFFDFTVILYNKDLFQSNKFYANNFNILKLFNNNFLNFSKFCLNNYYTYSSFRSKHSLLFNSCVFFSNSIFICFFIFNIQLLIQHNVLFFTFTITILFFVFILNRIAFKNFFYKSLLISF